MTPVKPIVKLKAKRPGPQGRWMQRAATDLGVTLSHLWQVEKGIRISRKLSARISEWRAANGGQNA